MIPQSFIQDLLGRVDIVDVVGRHVTLKKAGQNFLGLCPFHGEKTPSFTVSPSKQFFHCFGCGAHGSAIGFLMEHRGLGYVNAIRDLAQTAGMQVPEISGRAADAQQKSSSLTELLGKASDFYREQLKRSPDAIDYLKGRGLTGQTAARFGLGYTPDSWQPLRAAVEKYDDPRMVESGLVIAEEGKRYDRFRGRIMFPIRNARGLVIGFGARTLGAGEPKYLNSPETPVFHKGQELYGLAEARDAIRRSGRAIVVEDYMDVIQLAQAGFEESVAALGTAVTGAHVGALLRVTDHVIFAFDGDAAGRKAARRALEATLPVIADTRRASFVMLPEGEDPDSLIRGGGPAAFEAELARAMPLSHFFVRALTGGRTPGTAEDRAALIAEARPLLLSMAPGAMRLQLLRELAEAAKTQAESLESLYGLRRIAARPAPLERRTPHVEVADLKRRILQQLLVHPQLPREFSEAGPDLRWRQSGGLSSKVFRARGRPFINPLHRSYGKLSGKAKMERIHAAIKALHPALSDFLDKDQACGEDPQKTAYEIFKLMKDNSRGMLTSVASECLKRKCPRLRTFLSYLHREPVESEPVRPQKGELLSISYEPRGLEAYDD